MTGAGIVFFAYIGFDAVSTAAQEAKNPQRDMPIAIIGSLLLCTVLYILVSGIATGVVPYGQLDVPDPIAVVADHAGLDWMGRLIKLGAIAGLSSVILVMLLGQSRVFYSMARDGLLPPFVSRVHPRFRTPWLTSIVTGIGVAIFSAALHRPRGRQPLLDRHVAGVCYRVSRHPRAARARAESAAEIHDAVGLVCRAGGRSLRAGADVGAALADMATFVSLVRHRHRGLLLLRRAPEQAGAAAYYRLGGG